jgi:hypothetical protein
MRELKLLTDVGGRFDEGAGVYFNVKRGDIVKVSDAAAERLLAAGYCQTDLKAPPGRPFATPLWR